MKTTRSWSIFVPLAIYALGAVLYTWPMAALGNTAIPANSIGALDGWQTTWHLWWTARAVSQGRSPYFTDMLFYPDGVALFWQTLDAPLGLLMTPITLLFGPIAAYNGALLLSFVLGGVFTYLLAYHLTQHTVGSLAAGAIFAFAPFHFNRLLDGSLEHATIQWIPLYLLLLIFVIEQGRIWHYLATALCFVLIALTSWYYGLYTAVFSALFALMIFLTKGSRPFIRCVIVGALILLFMVPLIRFNLFIAANDNNVDYRQSLHSADLLDFVMPSPLHPLWGYPWGWLIHDFIGDWNVTLGWAVIGLAIIGLRSMWRELWWWLVLLLGTLALVIGPVLHIGGRDTGLTMPYALLNLVPGLRVGQRPVYMIVFSMLILGILAAYGIKTLWPTRGGRMLAIGCMLFAAFEFYPGILPTNAPQIHPFFLSLQGQPNEAILEIPDLWWSSAAMRDQMFHQWPITGGYIARRDGTYPFRDQTPGVRQLMIDEPFVEDILEPSEEAQTLRALDANGLRYVVMRHQVVADDQFEQLRGRLAQIFGNQPPIVDDDRLLVYRVPTPPTATRILMSLGTGWFAPEQNGARHWRWIDTRGTIFLSNTTDQPQTVRLRVEMSSFQIPRRAQWALDDQPLSTIAVPFHPTMSELRMRIPPGRHALTLTGLDAGIDADGRRLSVVVTRIKLLP